MFKKKTRPLGLILSLCICTASLSAQQGWDTAAVIIQSIAAPVFPDKDFSILSFGADSSGAADCTSAFKRAIDTCSVLGGGRVVVPQGTFLTGAIRLRSNVNLYAARGATIKFSTDTAKYVPVVYTRFESTELMNYSPLLYAYGDSNIAVTGEGTLDGRASSDNWWKWKNLYTVDDDSLQAMADRNLPVAQRIFGFGHKLRPNFFQPYSCKNILVSGVTFKNSPMWFLNPVLCTNVRISHVTVMVAAGDTCPNTDGCDPECCTNVLIEGCTFNTGDDCVAVKSGRNVDGHRVNVPCRNVVIRNCSMADGHGGVTIGSETAGGMRNIFAEHDTMSSANLQYALRFKSNTQRGGTIEQVYYRNILITKVSKAAVYATLSYNSETGSYLPVMKNVFLDSIVCTTAPEGLYLWGLKTSRITNLVLSNSIFSKITSKTLDTSYVSGLSFICDSLNGSFVTGVGRDWKEGPTSFALCQNYPNPFNPSTVIGYRLAASSHVTLKIYDLLGREVATLVDEMKPAGTYSVTFHAGKLSSGIYCYRMKAGEKIAVKKLLLLK